MPTVNFFEFLILARVSFVFPLTSQAPTENIKSAGFEAIPLKNENGAKLKLFKSLPLARVFSLKTQAMGLGIIVCVNRE